MSKGMFLGAIAGMLPTILPAITKLLPAVTNMFPAVGNVLGGLFGGKGKGGKGGVGPGLQQLIGEIGKPETQKMLTGLLGQLSGGKSLAAPGSAQAQALAYATATARSPEQEKMLAEAKAIPAALIAALPALMPILQKVLNPETIKAVLGELSPTKTIAAVTDSVEKVGKLGLQGQKQLMGHIEKLHPKLASEDKIIDMVNNMSVAQEVEPQYRRLDSVTLSFPSYTTVDLYGRERVLYRYGQPLGFPLTLDAPGTVRKATLQITIKDAESLEVLNHRKWGIKEVKPGPLAKVPTIPWSRLDSLSPGEDYLISACLTWHSTKSRKRVGTCRQTLVTLVDEYAFDHVEQGSELIPLSDPIRYREYWHQVWKGTFTSKLKRVTFRSRYYYKFDRERTANARMETVTKETDRGLKSRTAMLKTGMKLSADGLLKLRSKLVADTGVDSAPIDEGVLTALRTSDFESRFDQIGTATVDFRGRDGEGASLWAYPVVKLQRVKLKKVESTDDTGHVTQMSDQVVDFPMPVLMHLVGLKAE
jgi:hypothetical protein